MSTHEAARAIKRASREAAGRARNTMRGEVVDTEPLKVELFGSNVVLDDDDFDLSQWVCFYDKEFGIDRGDNVLLVRESGEWTITDVVADKDVDLKEAKNKPSEGWD